jgi:NAD(P)H-quinone oxidoreductase subunit 4L
MLPRSSIITVAYAAVATIVVLYYFYTCCMVTHSGMPVATTFLAGIPTDLGDVSASAILVALGALAVILGAEFPFILVLGTLGVFVCLTFRQDHLISLLTLAAVLFSMGVYGIVASRNAIRVLISIELMLNAVMINLVAFARYVDPGMIRGQIFAVFVLTVAAAEAAVGLAIVLAIYRSTSTVDMEEFTRLKW